MLMLLGRYLLLFNLNCFLQKNVLGVRRCGLFVNNAVGICAYKEWVDVVYVIAVDKRGKKRKIVEVKKNHEDGKLVGPRRTDDLALGAAGGK